MLKKLKDKLRCRRGEGYVDVVVLVLCAMLVLALAIRVLPVFIAKQQLDTFTGSEVRTGLLKKLRIILKDKSGVSFPLVIGVTLSLLLIFCGVSEYFRLQIIAAGVRDAVEDAIISTVNDNYAGVYHGVREGYSGGYMPYGEGEWEETLDEGDIYGRKLLPSMHITLRVQAGYIEVF